jgi:hypothetical protein
MPMSLEACARHQTGESIQRRSAQPLSFAGQPSPLLIIESGLLAQQFLEHANFLLQIFDHILLVAIHPSGRAQHHKSKRIHRLRMATPPWIRKPPLPFQNPLKVAAAGAKFEYLDTTRSASRLALLRMNPNILKLRNPLQFISFSS